MVSEELVFGASDQIKVMVVQQMDDQAILSVQSRSKGCPCPECNIFSSKLHSYYLWRLLKNMGDALQRLLERKRQQSIALQAQDAAQHLRHT